MSSLYELHKEITALKLMLIDGNTNVLSIGSWINKKTALRFLDYSDNQLRKLEKEGAIISSRIGRRKFYQKESIIKLIEKNIQQ